MKRYYIVLSLALLWHSAVTAGDPETAPDFTAQTFAGETVKLSDFKGDVVLLNYWASWCFPCRHEMPHFQKLYDTFKDEGFKVVAVAVYDQLEDAKAFQDKYQFSFPILFDHLGEAKTAFEIEVVPQTFLIGRDTRLIPIPNPKTGKAKLRVNDPTIWEHAATADFIAEVVKR